MQLIHELVLASESPRRKSLLEKAGFQITVYPVKVSEILEKNLNVRDQIQAISNRKWKAAREQWNRDQGRGALLLTADTMVVLDGQPLGKPTNSADAVATLRRLSGRTHEVITAVSIGLSSSPTCVEVQEITTVHFRKLSELEIQTYVATGEPLDKAGSYGIQGAAQIFVERIVGDFENVVGLPVARVQKILQENGWLK